MKLSSKSAANFRNFLKESQDEPKDKTLFDNEWLSVKQNSDGYVYSHESRCQGRIVAVLPYRRVGKDAWEFLLRKETCPPWGPESVHCSLTGGMDKAEEGEEETAQRELKEEAGYDVDLEDLVDLGACRGTKSTDTIFHLFAVDLADKDQGEAEGDGTEYEESASVEWGDSRDISNSLDPILAMLYCRASDKIGLY